jgi:Aerotolerance regulator N-terminal
MSIGFLDPALLWGLGAASLPLLIHLFFRRRPRPLAFPAFELVLRARRQTERRLKLRKLLLFMARTLVLAAVALALARPRSERPEAAAAVAAGPAATVILLDGSGSMGWRLGGETLFERGRREALAALTRLGSEEPVAALLCDGSPPRAVAPSFDRAAAREVLADARPTALHADLTACLAAAAQGLAEGRGQERLGKRIVVVTDLTATAWRLEAPPPELPGPAGRPVRPEVEVVDVAHGAALPNLAVTGLTAEPDAAVGPRGYRVTATVLNAGTERAAEVSLTLRAAGDTRPPVRAFLDLPPGGSVRKTFSHAFTAGGPAVLTAALPADPLALDDERSLTLRVPREVKALVVDGAPSPMKLRDEAWFVEAALGSAASPVRPTLIDAEALATADLRAFDVVLLLNVRTVGARGADLEAFVQAGGGLFLSMGDQVDPDAVDRELAGLLPLPLHLVKTAAAPGAERGAARLARIDEAHPALAVFTGEAREGLVGARFQRYMLTRPAGRGEPPVVLAAYDDGAPALVEARRGQGRVLLYTSTVDRDWTDWPLRTSFLPAMQRFAGWLSGALDDRRDPPTVVGTPRTLHLGPGRRLAALQEPDGTSRPARDLGASLATTADGGNDVTFTPRLPGVWRAQVEERGATRADGSLAFAAVVDPRESDTRRLEPEALTTWLGGRAIAHVDGPAGGAGGGAGVPLWSILLAVAVALFLAEAALLA